MLSVESVIFELAINSKGSFLSGFTVTLIAEPFAVSEAYLGLMLTGYK
jgi:hypothetical protein